MIYYIYRGRVKMNGKSDITQSELSKANNIISGILILSESDILIGIVERFSCLIIVLVIWFLGL